MASTSCRCHGTFPHAYMPGTGQRMKLWSPESLRMHARHCRVSTAAVADRSTALAEKGSEVCCGIPVLYVYLLHCTSSFNSSCFEWQAPFVACRAH